MLKVLGVGLLLFTLVQSVPLKFIKSPGTPEAINTEGSYRLPNNTRPLRYDVELITHLELDDSDTNKFRFEGKVEIHVQARETTSYITIQARQLRVLSSKIFNDRGEELEWLDRTQPSFEPAREFLTYKIKDYIHKDEVVVLKIEFSGFLRDDMGGFYRSSYTDEEGNKRWLATTQFESTNARHAFPCYDEPQIRAVYSLTIKAHKSFEPISNMPVLKKEELYALIYILFCGS